MHEDAPDTVTHEEAATGEAVASAGPAGAPADAGDAEADAPPLMDRFRALVAARTTPFLPPEKRCFADSDTAAARDLLADVTAMHTRFEEAAADDPYSNPIQRVALELGRRLDAGELKYAAIEQLIQELSAEAYVIRAERLGAYVGETDTTRNAERLRTLVEDLAWETGQDGARVQAPFETFKHTIEQALFGIVFTAHPTFSTPEPLLRALAELAVGSVGDGRPMGGDDIDARLRMAMDADHSPEPTLTLDREHELSMLAISHARAALSRVYGIVFEIAARLYPQNWRHIDPRLITIASWVGYDLDGRADIGWWQTFQKRLIVQAAQLRHHAAAVSDMIETHARAPRDEDLRRTLELVESRLVLTLRQVEDEIAGFAAASDDHDGDETDRIKALSSRMYAHLPQRVVDTGEVIDLINRAIGQMRTDEGARDLCVLRAEVANQGLGLAGTHVRLNASQLHNAVRKQIGMDSAPDDPTSRNRYLVAINGLIDEVEPVSINFGSLIAERASAKRLFMVVAQMLKYIDHSQPVRFLIAECDTPFTVLVALYYARLFGIEDRIEISPLFETETALRRGDQVIADLLDQPHYRDYVRKTRRLCIQTGFSDAGRYLGQTASAVAIERLQRRVGALLTAPDLAEVQLVVFNTHGESIGRGGHPASFVDRLNYICSPAVRAGLQEDGVELKQESSFQGGDGYLYFITPEMAFASVTRVLEHALGPLPPGEEKAAENGDNGEGGDPFYADPAGVEEFFSGVQHFNAEVMDDPNYAALLGAFGPNLLHKTGSRAFRRQHDYGEDGGGLHPSQIRAIPHNAILQQMGLLANTVGGLGRAVRGDPAGFRALYADSPRFRRLLGMVEYARAFSDLDVLKAYIDTLDPGLWLLRGSREPDRERREAIRQLVAHLERLDIHARLVRIFRKLRRDCSDLDDALRALRAETVVPAGHALVSAEKRSNLKLLHAIRIALIQQVYVLAMHIPDFSIQHDVDRDTLITHVLHLDVAHVIDSLNMIFPQTDAGDVQEGFGEPATYETEQAQSYLREHRTIFDPLSRFYELIRRVSAGVIHDIGAVG